jgi:hypothetical protein
VLFIWILFCCKVFPGKLQWWIKHIKQNVFVQQAQNDLPRLQPKCAHFFYLFILAEPIQNIIQKWSPDQKCLISAFKYIFIWLSTVMSHTVQKEYVSTPTCLFITNLSFLGCNDVDFLIKSHPLGRPVASVNIFYHFNYQIQEYDLQILIAKFYC